MDGNAIVTCLKFVELNLKLLMLMQASAMDQHVSGPHLADLLHTGSSNTFWRWMQLGCLAFLMPAVQSQGFSPR